MKTSVFKGFLRGYPDQNLQFILPDGGLIPIHAHITDVGRVDKTFLDCGASIRKISTLSLQAWVADDVDHRLPAGKLASIIDQASPVLGTDDLEVELEYEDGVISQFPIETATNSTGNLVFRLGTKHTDCLAKDICLPPAKGDLEEDASSCCSGSGCC
jgi:hypothetical protein